MTINDMQGRSLEQVSDNEDAAALCIVGLAFVCLLGGLYFVLRAIWSLFA